MTAALRNTIAAAAPGDFAALLAKSRLYCRKLTKRQAANFYYGMKLLPEPKRSAMYALYAYMRLVDDIADDDANGRTLEQRREDLDQWARLTREAIAAGANSALLPRGHILWPAFAELIRAYKVPAKIFEDMIAGQRQDLEGAAIGNFDDLHQYCYRVASVVGMASLFVWGFEGGEETLQLSAERGIAFQLTNVLRDLREDSGRGRCYLPPDEMARFGVTAAEIAAGAASARSPAFLKLMHFQAQRARDYYERSAALESRIQQDSRPTLRAMTAIYRGILEKIAANPGRVMRQRVRLGTPSKILIAWRAMRGK